MYSYCTEQAGVGVGQALQQFEERACPDGCCLLRSCHTHGIDPPLDPSCSKLRHSLTLPVLYVFVYNPPQTQPSQSPCRVTCTCTSSYPLKPHVMRFPLFWNFQLRLSRVESKHHALLRAAATALFVQTFTRNFYELNGIESEAFRSLNRLILLQKNITKLLLLILFHHILVNIETYIWHFQHSLVDTEVRKTM